MHNDTNINIYKVYTEKTLSKMIRKASTEKKPSFPTSQQPSSTINFEAKADTSQVSTPIIPSYLSPRGDNQ